MAREDRREGRASALAPACVRRSPGPVEIVNFVIAMLIAGLLAFVVVDVLARSLAADDAKSENR